ncbi:Hypothetical protein I5071_82510 [Sandaracinus amylolyticus]|nr:Hypothetical protein I5071_82510 [Sandaracinus amylolyticus]
MARGLLASLAHMPRSPLTRALSLVTLLFAFLAVGCGSRARFEVVRPALLDASQVGNTFSVQPFNGVDPNAAYQVQTMLQQRIANSLNPAIRLLAAGGGIIVTGDVMDFSYREDFSTAQTTCSRSVQYTDANGRQQTRTENYPCVQTTRWGNASASVRFVVMVANTGQVVFDRTYQDALQSSTSATNGRPAPIDGRGMLESMIGSFVGQFARVILPWPDTVEVAFTDCGGADGCGQAFDLVRAGNLQGAEQVYTQILGPYDDASAQLNPEDADIVSKTLFNRGVIRAYTGSYELGMQDLQRAIAIRPGEQQWQEELAQIEQLAAEQEALASQMGQAMAQAQGGSAVQQVQ